MIELDLLNLNAKYYFEEDKAIFKKYLNKEFSVELINSIIKLLIDEEFYFFITEDCPISSLNKTKYKEIDRIEFNELKKIESILGEIEYSENIYVNFEYKNGKYVNDQLGEDYLKQNIPGLFHFNDNIITYYFLEGNEGYLNPDNA